MTIPISPETRAAIPWRRRPAAWLAVGLARPLSSIPPARLRSILEFARRGARPATEDQAHRAREAVVAVSARCAGQGCLQRAVAAALFCRLRGRWPEWRTGVRTEPFRAHAWVAVDGRAVGEDDDIQYFLPVMTVPPVSRARRRADPEPEDAYRTG